MGRIEGATSTGRLAGKELGETDGTGIGGARGELRGPRGGHPVPAGEHPQGDLDDAEHRAAPPERRRLLRHGGAQHRVDAGLQPEAAQERGDVVVDVAVGQRGRVVVHLVHHVDEVRHLDQVQIGDRRGRTPVSRDHDRRERGLAGDDHGVARVLRSGFGRAVELGQTDRRGEGVGLAVVGMRLHHLNGGPPCRLEVEVRDPAERARDLLQIRLGVADRGPGLHLHDDGFRCRAGHGSEGQDVGALLGRTPHRLRGQLLERHDLAHAAAVQRRGEELPEVALPGRTR